MISYGVVESGAGNVGWLDKIEIRAYAINAKCSLVIPLSGQVPFHEVLAHDNMLNSSFVE